LIDESSMELLRNSGIEATERQPPRAVHYRQRTGEGRSFVSFFKLPTRAGKFAALILQRDTKLEAQIFVYESSHFFIVASVP
jgi:hypothetical protein